MNILIVGDSYSANCGFNDPTGKLWHSMLSSHQITNLSVDGQSNYKIFIKAANALLTVKYDLVIVQWSSLFRLTFNNNQSIHETTTICNIGRTTDPNISSFHKYWQKHYTHGYIELIEFLTMCGALAQLIKYSDTPYIFVKTFDNFISELTVADWKDCSESYKCVVLIKDGHPDSDITTYHNTARELFSKLLELTADSWLNLTATAWHDARIDFADDHGHPGINSNKNYYDQICMFARTLDIEL